MMEEEPLLIDAQSRHNTSYQNGEGYERRSFFSLLSLRCGNTRKCVSSKAALLILLWSFILGLWNGLFLHPEVYVKNFPYIYLICLLVGFSFVAMVMCFFPLAGFLADTKYGRYKTVVRSLCLLLISIPLLIAAGGALTGVMFLLDYFILWIIMIIFTSVFLFLVVVLFFTGVVGFTANVIQFGMDQLHDSPGEERTLFIHWYVWTYYLSIFTGQLGWILVGYSMMYDDNYGDTLFLLHIVLGSCILGLIPLVVIVVVATTLCLARCRRRWFLIEPGTVNPYKLVYRVTKFARQHKVPVNRSAFTYCEDEVPTGLDLAKDKYGGPFTTEQVEDVKAFYGILKVLFSFGIIFSLDIATESLVTIYSEYASFNCPSDYNYTDQYSDYTSFGCAFDYNCTDQWTALIAMSTKHVLFSNGLFSPLLTVVCIPLYLCLLRPIMSHHVSMLRRVGLGILSSVLSVAAFFTLDLFAHESKHSGPECMFTYFYNASCSQDPVYLIFPLTLSSLSHMLIYPAVFEFICSQSPHSMKGLLIGLLYTIKGLFQLLATVFVIPFAVGLLESAQPSCDFYYYLTNIVFGVLGFVLFVWVSKKYQFRKRDEPSNIYRYAEEYYSNPQQEQEFDYSYSEM